MMGNVSKLKKVWSSELPAEFLNEAPVELAGDRGAHLESVKQKDFPS